MTVVLLGTAGGPVMWRGRSGISTAVTVEDRAYVVDLGLGGGALPGGRFVMESVAPRVDHPHALGSHPRPPAGAAGPWNLPGESSTDTVGNGGVSE